VQRFKAPGSRARDTPVLEGQMALDLGWDKKLKDGGKKDGENLILSHEDLKSSKTNWVYSSTSQTVVFIMAKLEFSLPADFI
jgi:hypothetical protein